MLWRRKLGEELRDPLSEPIPFHRCYPGISPMRFCIFSGERSSMWVAMLSTGLRTVAPALMA